MSVNSTFVIRTVSVVLPNHSGCEKPPPLRAIAGKAQHHKDRHSHTIDLQSNFILRLFQVNTSAKVKKNADSRHCGSKKVKSAASFHRMRSPNGRTSNYNPAEMAGQCTHARRNTGRTSAPSSAANGETACGVPNCTLRQVLEYSAQSTLAHGARRCRAQSRKCTERQVPATARSVRRRNHVECQTRDLPHFSTTAP